MQIEMEQPRSKSEKKSLVAVQAILRKARVCRELQSGCPNGLVNQDHCWSFARPEGQALGKISGTLKYNFLKWEFIHEGNFLVYFQYIDLLLLLLQVILRVSDLYIFPKFCTLTLSRTVLRHQYVTAPRNGFINLLIKVLFTCLVFHVPRINDSRSK